MQQETSDILKIIRTNFPELAEPQLQEEIAKVGKIYEFRAGEVIMDFGAYIKMMPLLIKGSIKVVREDDEGHELFLYFLQAGETCSMTFTCCMMDKESMIRTTAEDDAMLIGIPVRYMDEWMGKYKSWRNFVMLSYDNRMYELVQTIDDITFKQLDKRLLEYLEKKSRAIGSKTIHTTHQDIGNDLNASREAISRLLKQFEKMGKVNLERNKIHLK